MTPRQRIAIRLAFVFVTLAGGLLTMAMTHTSSHASCSTCTGTFYGVYENAMTKAIGGTIWPQATSNACAITDAIGVVNYDYVRYGFPLKFINRDSQTLIQKENQLSGASEWGARHPDQ